MAHLRLAMDAAFWDLNISSPQTLEGTARSVPGEPVPLALARASRTIRPQQLSFLANAFPLGIIPSFASTSQKELGSFSVQYLLPSPAASNWWVGLVSQFRPRKLISSIKKEVASADELELPAFKDVAKHFLDKSLYALGLFSHLSLTDDTSLLFNLERHYYKSVRRLKAVLFHRLPNHDITLEAACPELFVDRNGTYWDVPTSISLDITSLVSDSGLRYRFGLHKNGGQPEALNSSSCKVPLSLMPGICAKAAFSYEKSRDLWREKDDNNAGARKVEKEPTWESSYDVRLKEPHAAISGIVGGTCAVWFGGDENIDVNVEAQLREGEVGRRLSWSSKKRNPFSVDLFGSLCYSLQHGKFKNDFNDLTRIDARLDICSASAFMKGACHLFSDILRGRVDREVNPLASPKLNVILQQQVAGPIVFRVDSRVSLTSPSGKHIPHVEDVMYGLSYSFRLLQSGKILAWFSPKRKEAMVELRFFEF
ncbi:protein TRIGALACTOSYLDIACYLGLYCEROL 4, chloroplastic [Phoenix dactylifera]|uniref:Protein TRIGALACTOSYLDIACYLGLYCEROL 4, chloroplastic n=1 Tax=Phoenix dactylifera TaxID=42345 RepID=A0A8B7BZU9_PHODC|nr:protein TRIGALACTOSYLDIACYLGLYCEROL 4, chloroplastic [Phoenix dactylifera]